MAALSRWIVSVLLIGLLWIGGLGRFGLLPLVEVGPAVAQTPVESQSANFVVQAVQKVGPAVVRIDTDRTVTRHGPSPFAPFEQDPFFRRFFGDDFGFEDLPQEFHERGQGSGFVIDRNGVILTNAHVVDRADTVRVQLRDGRTFAGTVKGIDEILDLAVVTVNARDLPVASLGDSSTVRVGDWAIALGNPLGLDSTVTLGIVSTLKRSSAEVGIPDKRLDFIQTDAAINPGNSGGPLLNSRGEVIGINTAIRSDAQGIGFAIPINVVKEVKDRLVRGQAVPHPYVGIQMATLTPQIRDRLNRDPNSGLFIESDTGVLVLGVEPNSPAAAAGIRVGDIIQQVNRRPIRTAEDLQQVVQQSPVGSSLQADVERSGQMRSLRLRIGNLTSSG
jgi:S1-C subfamily serine protease